jgi:preprotein translocase subunit YajC
MLNQIFVSDAFAQASDVAAAAPEASYTSFIPLVLIFAIFYFLIVRPQSKKMKEHQALINNLKVGNKVITSGGIIGVVKDVFPQDNQVEVEITEGVRVKILKNYVIDLVNSQDQEAKKTKKKK